MSGKIKLMPELSKTHLIEVFLNRALGTCLRCGEEMFIAENSNGEDFVLECPNCNIRIFLEVE